MKLISCHIENFGKLSDLSVNFSEGINVINESNAWGKSTLAAFLKVMFYGLDAKKDPKAFDKERNIYRPWQGGAFGGEVDFEIEGRCYRISRSFGRTEKSDEFHLYDLSTNLECDDYSSDIGLEIFELDSASFKRSIYIAQNDCASATSDSINAKLGNLAENTDDINNFEAASSRMKAMLLSLTPDRVTGSIKKRKGQITQLEQEVRMFEAASNGLDGVKAMEAKVHDRIVEMQGIRKNYADALVIASEDARRKELYAQYEALCEDVAKKEEQLLPFKNIFPREIPSDQEFEHQMRNIRQMEDALAAVRNQTFTEAEQAEWNKLSGMFVEEIPTDERIDAAIDMITEVEKQKAEIARQETTLNMYKAEMDKEVETPHFSGAYHIIRFIGIGMFLAGVVLLVLSYLHMLPIDGEIYDSVSANIQIASIVTIGVGVLIFLIGLVWGIKIKKAKKIWIETTKAAYEELEDAYHALASTISGMKKDVHKVNETIGEFLGKCHAYCEVKDYQSRLYELKGQAHEYERMRARQESLTCDESTVDKFRQEVLRFFDEYGLALGADMASVLRTLQNKATEYKMAKTQYQESVDKKEAFEKRQDKTFWTKEMRCPYTVEELNEMIQDADRNLEELKASRAQYRKQLEELEEQLDLRDEKLAELQEMNELQEQEMRKYNLISVTHEFLQRAKEQLTARYMEPIANGFSKYYQMLTGDTSGNWQIDANINLKMREFGELRDTKWLSAGYQDLVGVCMRLALVDAMYEDEKPFLILDDPFVNLDEEKLNCGNKLLLAVAEEYQVIYFTCHDSRSPV